MSPSDKAEGIELRTRWIVFCWMPLIPLGSYRIRMYRTGWSARGRMIRNFELLSVESLSIAQVLRIWLITLTVIGLAALLFVWLDV